MFHSSNQPSRRGVLLCQISCLVTNMVSVYFDVSASNGKHYQQWCDVFKVNKKVFQIYSFYLPRKRRKELSTNYAKTESPVNFKPTGKQLSNACARKRGKFFNQWEGPQVSIILHLFSGGLMSQFSLASLHYYKWHTLTLWLMVFFLFIVCISSFPKKKLKNAREERYGHARWLELTLTGHRSLGGVGWGRGEGVVRPQVLKDLECCI